MTAQEIISANPEYNFVPCDIGGMNGLKGKSPETGLEHWCVYAGNYHVAATGPWDRKMIRAAAQNLRGAAGYAYAKRRTQPNRTEASP